MGPGLCGRSGSAWSGTLTVSGTLRATILRFGTGSDGLSAVCIGGDRVGLTEEGYLYRIRAGTQLLVR